MISYIFYIVLTAFALAQGNPQKINISVYYEVLCYHSVRHIQTQLYPTWIELKDYINVDLVPYGKAAHFRNENASWNITCHFGPRQCYGNKIQACALNEFDNDISKAMDYVRCSVNFNVHYPFNTTCFEDTANNDEQSIARYNECVNSQKGDELIAKFGDKTPSLSYVPAVEINGVRNERAEKHLKEIVCSLIEPANRPSACV